MRVEPDDEVYRVNAVWLGPEHFQFPWRATYRSYGLGLVLFVVLMAIVRQLYGITFWSFVFVLVFAIKLTQIVNRRMGYERPFSSVLAMALAEINAPRQSSKVRGVVLASRAVVKAPPVEVEDDQKSKSRSIRWRRAGARAPLEGERDQQ